MTYSLIIFDCDGTLVDSEYLNLKAIFEVIGEFGITHYDTNYAMTHFSGLRFSSIIGMIEQDTDVQFPDNIARRYLERVRALAPTEMKAVDGVHDMVQTAKQQADHICVVSNGERTNVLMSLELVGLQNFFEEEDIITGLMAPNPKPAPDLFLLAAEKKNIPPSQTLVVEDSAAGVQAAIAAGMEAWGFCGTHHEPENQAEKLLALGATETYCSMSDIVRDLIKKVQ